MKFAILAVASLLFSVPTFAAPAATPEPRTADSYDTTGVAPVALSFLDIEVDGQVFMKLRLDTQPKDMRIAAQSKGGATYDSEKAVTTLKGPASIIASQGDKTLWTLSFPSGTVTLKQLVVVNLTSTPWSKERLHPLTAPTALTAPAGG